MKKIIMIMTICAVIAMGLATPLSAQTIYGEPTGTETGGVSPLASNTNVATAGIFKNDVDNFVDYHEYSGVLKDDAKWFGFLTGRTDFNGALDAGYARNFGSIYLGAWYRGNIFRSTNTAHETNTITPDYDDVFEILNKKTETTAYNEAYNESTNNFEFLIGVVGMGIKVGFFESTSSNKNDGSPARNVDVTDYLDGRKDYVNVVDNYTKSRSYLKPYLGWGGTFSVAGMSLKPYADIGFGIYSDTQIDKYRSYNEVNGEKRNVVTSVGAGYNNEYLLPYGKFGAWLDFAQKDTVQQSVGLSYAIDLYLYGNDADGLGSVDGTVSWNAGYINRETIYADRIETQTDITYNIEEISNIWHTITPAYMITGEPGENFKLGFSADIPIAFGFSSSDRYSKQIQKTAVKYYNGLPGHVTESENLNYNGDGNTERSVFQVNLDLAVGASYQLIPNRFGLNAGISVTPVSYTRTVDKVIPRTTGSISTEKTTEEDGTVTQNDKTVTLKTEADSITESSVWSQYTATLRGGFTFNFNDHAALDMAVQSGRFTANTFNLNLTTVNVIFTLKY